MDIDMRNNHLNDNKAFIVRLFCLPFDQKETTSSMFTSKTEW